MLHVEDGNESGGDEGKTGRGTVQEAHGDVDRLIGWGRRAYRKEGSYLASSSRAAATILKRNIVSGACLVALEWK